MSFRSLALALLASILPPAQAAPATSAAGICGQPGQWLIPPTLALPAAHPEAAGELLDRLAGKHVVLLGENHDCADDHRWQLDMLTALRQRQPDLAIGFEMFPRRAQPVLDRWVAGQLSETEFLKQVEWGDVWNYDAQLYLPLFRFARQYHLPMLALNVDIGLVSQVRASGWEGVPESRREGVGRPAEPSPSYRTELKVAFDEHPTLAHGDAATQFTHFVEAQTVWDRAMAEGIAKFRRDHSATLVVGILGAGHVRHGYGVSHQLQALGTGQIANLMTLPSDHACAELTPGLADAVYVIPPQPEWQPGPPPRLGVGLREVADGVMIETVMPGSLAERTGLRNGDVILQAAGSKVSRIEEVRGYVQRQPAGTWLPLLIRRGTAGMEIVVRFPASNETGKP
jgi:uncharacterized iron-regulated protein